MLANARPWPIVQLITRQAAAGPRSLMHTLKFAFRQILLRPAFSLMAAFSLALGVGLVSTQFSLIDAVLLRGIPAPDAQRIMRIVRLAQTNRGGFDWQDFAPFRDFLAFRERQTSFDVIAASTTRGMNLSRPGRLPSWHLGSLTTANVPTLLGVQPLLGRWFTADEDQIGQPQFVVLSHQLWQDEFAADPHVLGTAITLNGTPATVIGVMPPRFAFPTSERLWVNLRTGPNDPRTTDIDRVEMIGHLKRGVEPAQAQAEMDAIAAALARQWPETNEGRTRMDMRKIAFAYAGSGTVSILVLLLAMTVFILALACVNVANMLLGRATARTREFAVRSALGADRGRLVRQFLGESLVLAALGCAGGLWLSLMGVEMLSHYLAQMPGLPNWFDFRLDLRVVAATMGLTVIAGLLSGLVPALHASRVNVNTALKEHALATSGTELGRIARWLVTAQIAFSSALLVAACVLGWTVYQTRQANLRYNPDHLLTGRLEVQDATHPTLADRARFFRELMQRIQSEPGVEAVAVSSRNLTNSGLSVPVTIDGVVPTHPNERPLVWGEVVSSDYFKLLGVSALRGRLFDQREQAAEVRSAIINESFARKFWPRQNPIGRRFRSDDDWMTVIGVVPDLKMQGLMAPAGADEAGFYLAQDQMGWGWLDIFIRTKGDPMKLVDPVRRAIASLDANQPIHSIGTLTGTTAQAIRGYSAIGLMAAVFAVVTLFLGSVGVYGVTSLAVSRRTREFGVRMALGATLGQVLGMVLAQGGRQIVIGLAFGLTGGFLLTRPLLDVFGTGVMNNPFVYLVVAGVTALVSLGALWIPARRAAQIDPMIALRTD